MRMGRFSPLVAAAVAIALGGVGGGAPRPAPAPVRRRRTRRADGGYLPKIPTTAADHEAVRLAEMKRWGKGAKAAADYAATWANYHRRGRAD